MLPSQSHSWQWLEGEFLKLTSLYGYREIRTPTFEDEGLFTRTSGETSDIVTKQMYNFRDKGDRPIALKPEGTAPIIRSLIEHSLCQPGTVCRLSYITPIFRYERPQKGRLREAHQVGIEIIGSASIEADAEIIEMTVAFYRRLGLTRLNVLLNSLGRDECRASYRAAILSHAADFLARQSEDFQAKVNKNPLRLLDSKDPEVQDLMIKGPSILDFLETECRERFGMLQRILDDAGIMYSVDPRIVRGLDYYTETVFEVQSSKLGAQSSLCGGGRYDGLVKELGGPSTPAVGVAMGIERALIVLEEVGLLPAPPRIDVFLATTGGSMHKEAMKLAAHLRSLGISVVMDLEGKSLKSQLRQADRSNARFAVVMGDDEFKDRSVAFRILESGEQLTLGIDELAPRVLGEQLVEDLKSER